MMLLFTAFVMASGCSKTATPTQAVYQTSAAATATPEMANFTQGERYCDFSPRSGFSTAAFNDGIYVAAGSAASAAKNDVWFTTDCEHWQTATASADFPAREEAELLNFNNKLWLTGGKSQVKSAAVYYNDIWASADGVSWTAVNSTAPFEGRADFNFFAGNKTMYIACGYGQGAYYNDVWSSKDGKNWVRLKDNSASGFSPRLGAGAFFLNDKIWIVGGREKSKGLITDVWNSENGADWKTVTVAAGFSPREDFTSFVYKNRMWVIGGADAKGNTLSDIWWSVNGYYWVSTTAKAAFGGRRGMKAVEYRDKIWLLGGRDNNKIKRDLWYGQ